MVGSNNISTFAYRNSINNQIKTIKVWNFNHIEPKFLEKFPRMINTLYTGPLYWMIIGYFFTPKILKDAQKLKEEQDLTV